MFIRAAFLMSAFVATTLADIACRSDVYMPELRSPEEVLRARIALETAELERREQECEARRKLARQEALRIEAELQDEVQSEILLALNRLRLKGWDCHGAHLRQVVTRVERAKTIFGKVYVKSLEYAELTCWQISYGSDGIMLASDGVLYTCKRYWWYDMPDGKGGRSLRAGYYPLDGCKLDQNALHLVRNRLKDLSES